MVYSESAIQFDRRRVILCSVTFRPCLTRSLSYSERGSLVYPRCGDRAGLVRHGRSPKVCPSQFALEFFRDTRNRHRRQLAWRPSIPPHTGRGTFCPNVFILEDHPASDKGPKIWVLYFDASAPVSESNDQIAAGAIKQLSPLLKSKGYHYASAQRDDSGIELLWTGPSKTYVWVSTYAATVSSPDDAGFKIQVEHYLK